MKNYRKPSEKQVTLAKTTVKFNAKNDWDFRKRLLVEKYNLRFGSVIYHVHLAPCGDRVDFSPAPRHCFAVSKLKVIGVSYPGYLLVNGQRVDEDFIFLDEPDAIASCEKLNAGEPNEH